MAPNEKHLQKLPNLKACLNYMGMGHYLRKRDGHLMHPSQDIIYFYTLPAG